MEINRTAYPNPTKIPEGAGYYSSYAQNFDIKAPVFESWTRPSDSTVFNYQTLWGGAWTGTLQKNKHIDTSVCYCAINGEADIANWNWSYRKGSSGAYSLDSSVCTSGTQPVMMALWSTADYPNHRWGYAQNDDTEGGWCVIPLTDYRWCDFVICPVIWASATETGSTTGYTLQEYESHREDHPYVREIQMRIYLGTGSNATQVTPISRYRIDNAQTGNYPSHHTETSNTNINMNFKFVRITEIQNPEGWENEYNNYFKSGIQYDTRCCGYMLIGREDLSPITSLSGGSSSAPITNGTFAGNTSDWEVRPTNSSYTSASTYYVGGEDIIHYALRQAAYIGLPFTDNLTSAQQTEINSSMTDEHMYLPIFDENGITTGTYASGTAAAALPQASWGENWAEGTPWSGQGFDPNDYDENNISIQPNLVGFQTIGASAYVGSAANVNNLMWGCNQTYETIADAIITDMSTDDDWTWGNNKLHLELVKAYGRTENPFDCFINIVAYPFDIKSVLDYTDVSSVKVGHTNVSLIGYTVGKLNQGLVHNVTLDAGKCSYFKEYTNFLDYRPYSTAELYIPFCGSVPIDPEIFMGHDIWVTYSLDVQTGLCTALIHRDQLVVDTIDGQMGQKLTVSAMDAQQYFSQLCNAASNIKAQKNALNANATSAATGLVMGAAGAASGNIMGLGLMGQALNKGMQLYNQSEQIKSAEYSMNTISIPFKQSSQATSAIAARMEPYPRLVIYRPTFLQGNSQNDFGNYGHTTGFACLENKTLDNFSGLTVCSSIDTSGIQATEAELKEIESAAKSGFYL